MKNLVVNIIFLIGLVFVSCSKKDKKYVDKQVVKTQKVQKTDFVKKIYLVGEIEAAKSVDIFSKIPARIKSYANQEKKYLVGSYVKKDEIIAVLEHDDLKVNLDRAAVAFQMSEANLEIASLNLEKSKKDFEKIVNLFEKGAVTKDQKDTHENNIKILKAQKDLAIARSNEANLACKHAKITFDNAFLKSPINGILTKKYVSENNSASVSSPVVNISSLDKLKISLGVPEKIISLIDTKSTEANVQVDAYPSKIFKAKIARIYPTVDKNTRSCKVVLKIDENKYLKPGMYANITLFFKKEDPCLQIPYSSLIYHNGSYHAYINEDNKAVLKEIKIGDRSDDLVEVVSGIKENDDLVVLGQNQLSDLTEITVNNQEIENENN